MTIIVNCPHCQTVVAWTEKNTYRPFCSKRCKLIDFGAWASEEHKIPSSMVENPEDFPETGFENPFGSGEDKTLN